jgi:hypothetical protein
MSERRLAGWIAEYRRTAIVLGAAGMRASLAETSQMGEVADSLAGPSLEKESGNQRCRRSGGS